MRTLFNKLKTNFHKFPLYLALTTMLLIPPNVSHAYTDTYEDAPVNLYIYPYVETRTWMPVITYESGVMIVTDAGRSQSFPIKDPVSDEFFKYSTKHSTQVCPLYNIFLGAEWFGLPYWSLQTGIDYTTTSSFSAKGTLTQGADVQSENIYSYKYRISFHQLLFAGKLIYMNSGCYKPYLSYGLGTSFNKARHFSTTVPDTLTFTRQYKSKLHTSFSYAVGTGLDYEFGDIGRIGIGYRFVDLGKVTLGSATIDKVPVKGTLSQSNFYANEIIVQITSMF